MRLLRLFRWPYWICIYGWLSVVLWSGEISGQGIKPFQIPKAHGEFWLKWADQLEFELADLALRFTAYPQEEWRLTRPEGIDGGDLAWYGSIQAAYRLDQGTDLMFQSYVKNYPNHPRIDEARLAYAVYLIQQGRDTEALPILDSLNWYQLTVTTAQQYHYLLGRLVYASDTLRAIGHWQQAASVHGDFQVHARYSLMLHRLHHFDINGVMELLDLLQADERYEGLCVYPRALVNALDGDTSAALALIDFHMMRPKVKGKLALSLLGVHLSYHCSMPYRYPGYLQAAVDQGYQKVSVDTLRLAQMYSLVMAWDTVTLLLKKIDHWPDSIKTMAYYVQGNAWLAWGLDEKLDRYLARARNSFQRVTELEVSGIMRESAFYWYAKLCYEIGESPANFRVLGSFLMQYPRSDFREEISEYLSDLAMKAHHYVESLRILRGVSNKSPKVQAIVQKLYYQQGITLYNQKRYVEALPFLDSSLTYMIDSFIRSATLFWKSELYHRVGEYNQAFLWMKNYLDFEYFQPDLRALGCHPMAANYQLGHLAFRLKRHPQAVKFLLQAVRNGQSMENRSDFETAMYRDAHLRLGDAYLRDDQVDLAVRQFSYCIDELRTEVEYANYQLAIAYGIQKKTLKKRDQLVALIQDYPRSDYRIYGLLELATTCFHESSFDSAMWCIRKLEEDYPMQSLTFVAMNLRGSIYLELGQDSLALTVFEEVVQKAAGLPEGRDALFELRQLCIRTSQPQRYMDIAGKNGLIAVQDDAMDSLLFETAQFSMESGKFFEALATLTQYLSDYPLGSFKANALYMRSFAAAQVGDKSMQISDLEALMLMPDNLFTERGMFMLAELYTSKEQWTQATSVFLRILRGSFSVTSRLEAAMGLIRASTILKQWSTVDSIGAIYLPMISLGQNTRNELRWHLANSMRYQGKATQARQNLRYLSDSTTTEWAARAMFNLAEMAFEERQYAVSQDLLFNLTDRWPQYSEWYGQGLFLLAENLLALNEKDQAVAVLQNLIEGRDADEISRKAENRLREINKP
ncbi:MAG: tetratricopeptide repeat protein [Sphingomonadales bacterium]|nr:tetratricopeptide repeat protein [Sphingomonadales bacterium]